jgi:hypothetical protein
MVPTGRTFADAADEYLRYQAGASRRRSATRRR